MLLLIMCCDLEVADRRMTPAIKLVFAQAFVAGSTSLVRQLMGDGMFHHSAFAQGSSATLRLHLRAQLLRELFVLADAQASPVPVRGSGTLSTHGARIARRRRKLGRLAWDHRDALPPRTGHLHPCKVHREIMFGKKRTTVRPRTCDHGDTLLRPLGHPGAGHVPQIAIELQQAGGFLQRRGQQLDCLMLRLIGRPDHDLPDDFAIHIDGKVLLEAVEGFCTALAAVAPVLILDREAPVRRDGLRETPAARAPVRIRFGVLGDIWAMCP